MLVAFPEKRFAKCDDVLCFAELLAWRWLGKPEPNAIQEVKTTGVGYSVVTRAVIRAEKNRGRKDSLKALDDAAIMAAVLGEVKKLEHLGRAAEKLGAAANVAPASCRPPLN